MYAVTVGGLIVVINAQELQLCIAVLAFGVVHPMISQLKDKDVVIASSVQVWEEINVVVVAFIVLLNG